MWKEAVVAWFVLLRRGLISLWLYKENNKVWDWKNVFTLHIPPPRAPHTYDFGVLTFNPSKKHSFGCAANRKSQRLISTLRFPAFTCRASGKLSCSSRDSNPRLPDTLTAVRYKFVHFIVWGLWCEMGTGIVLNWTAAKNFANLICFWNIWENVNRIKTNMAHPAFQYNRIWDGGSVCFSGSPVLLCIANNGLATRHNNSMLRYQNAKYNIVTPIFRIIWNPRENWPKKSHILSFFVEFSYLFFSFHLCVCFTFRKQNNKDNGVSGNLSIISLLPAIMITWLLSPLP
jgi:hypothetical protein